MSTAGAARNRRGRPSIDDDLPAPLLMAQFLAADGTVSERRAAERARLELGIAGQSPAAVTGRLRRKFGQSRQRLLEVAQGRSDLSASHSAFMF